MAALADQALPGAARHAGRLGFRAEIEGLRGVAVLLVVLYHATFAWIEGGYVGVDVFFVISGYLITRLLIDEFETGTFSVRNFYVRRIRRLIPSLLATILVTLAAGIVILSPEHLRELASSSLAAALSLSNFNFALSDGYFETSSRIKPLLHTWSLSVEEQFYLLWPFTLFVIFRVAALRRHLFLIVGLVLVAGLVLSEFAIGQNPAWAYFLLPFRAYQLLTGALAVWAERRLAGAGRGTSTALTVAGIGLVLGSALVFDEASPFPGFHGAVPALGGFLIVAAGGRAPLPARLLSVAPLTALGRISYSVYLAHWPIVVFARYLSVGPFTSLEKWLLCAASVGGGWLLFYTVEARFRLSGAGKGSGHRWRETLGVAATAALVLALSFGVRETGGLPGRMDLVPEKREMARAMGFEFLEEYRNGVLQLGSGTNGRRVLIFGDSMMQNYVPALMALPGIAEAEVTVVTRGGCPMAAGSLQVVNGGVDRSCRDLRDRLYADKGQYDLAIWNQSWMEYSDRLFLEQEGGFVPAGGEGIDRWRKAILATEAALVPRVGQLVVFGPQVTVENVPEILSRIGPVTDIAAIPPTYSVMTARDAAARERFAAALAELLPGAKVVDPGRIVCPGGVCRFSDGAMSWYLDPIHHTAAATPMLTGALLPELAGVLK